MVGLDLWNLFVIELAAPCHSSFLLPYPPFFTPAISASITRVSILAPSLCIVYMAAVSTDLIFAR